MLGQRVGRAEISLLFLLLSAAAFSVPGLIRLSKRAATVAGSDYEERRRSLFGELYESLAKLVTELPAGEDVAILMNRPRDVDGAVLVNYHVYPRRARFYAGLDYYRNDFSSTRPDTLWYVDLDRTPEVREMSYEEIRAEQSEGDIPVSPPVPMAELKGEWIVPLVVAVDGAARDRYVTEARFSSRKKTEVRLHLLPDGSQCSLVVNPGRPLEVSDLMTHCFGRMGAGWVRVSSDEPVRTGYWFVNRGSRAVAALQVFQELPVMPVVIGGGEKLWLINPHGELVHADVNGEPVDLFAYALVTLTPLAERNRVHASRPVIAFTSQKETDGNTTFRWPETVK